MVSIFGRDPSPNVQDLRTGGAGSSGMSTGAMAGLGLGGMAAAAALSVGMAGVDTTLCWVGLGECAVSETRREALDQFAAVILGDTERVWSADFAASDLTYEPATLVLHDSAQRSGCGAISAGQGPSYCSADKRIYLDLAFFDRIADQDGVSGDFPPAFIIAHEVAHHVQSQTGDFDRFLDALAAPDAEPLNQLQVRLELQADCLAGVWTAQAEAAFSLLEPGDIEEAIKAATVFGADAQQVESIGYVIESAFTHGTSAQRANWFRIGLEGGARDVCDTWTPAYDAL